MKRIIRTSAVIVLSVTMLFTGCKRSDKVSGPAIDKETPQVTTSYTEETTTSDAIVPEEFVDDPVEQARFDEFTDGIFKKELSENGLNLHYTIANPENFGIDKYDIKIGSCRLEDMERDIEDEKEYLETLNSFNYNGLTREQRITYDILKQMLQTDIENEDLNIYTEMLSKTCGEQAQLPIVMAEYSFYREQDVKDYLELLKTIPDYMDSIIEFQKEKVKAGLFMADFAVDEVTAQCEDFIKKPDENVLLTTFNTRIESVNISPVAMKDYKEQNEEIVKDIVIPAYQKLIDELKALKGSGKNEGGLCNYPEGIRYYQYLINTSVGSYKTVEEISELLEQKYTADLTSCSMIYALNPNILDELEEYTEVDPKDSPENILDYLKSQIGDAFPEGGSNEFTVKYVDESLEEFVSPAFYLTPAIDKTDDNSIYINKSDKYEEASMMSTLAHEGYPGHLYQETYFAQTNPSLIRNMFNVTGYTEGWATYVEAYSYNYGGLSEAAAKFNRINTTLTLNVYSQIDVGVNYKGWTREETEKFLAKSFGEEVAKENVDEIYNAMVEEPANYLNYYLGYLEIDALKTKAEKQLGDKFNLKEFNKFILDFGPAQFNVIEKYLDVWMSENY